jgi:hypothetical protein
MAGRSARRLSKAMPPRPLPGSRRLATPEPSSENGTRMSILTHTPDNVIPRMMTREDVARLALAQLTAYVARLDRMSGYDVATVRDALANAVVDIHAAGVKL